MNPLLPVPTHMPADWPVRASDLVMGYVGPILVVRIGAGLTADGFARYFKEWLRSVDARPADAVVYAMYDLPVWPGMTAVQRREWATMLSSREGVLRKTTRGVILATPSPLTRGGIRAIFWLAPPPYPYAVVDTPATAFEYIAERGGPPAPSAIADYAALVKGR